MNHNNLSTSHHHPLWSSLPKQQKRHILYSKHKLFKSLDYHRMIYLQLFITCDIQSFSYLAITMSVCMIFLKINRIYIKKQSKTIFKTIRELFNFAVECMQMPCLIFNILFTASFHEILFITKWSTWSYYRVLIHFELTQFVKGSSNF